MTLLTTSWGAGDPGPDEAAAAQLVRVADFQPQEAAARLEEEIREAVLGTVGTAAGAALPSQGAGKAVSGRCFCQVHFGAGGLSHCAQHSLTHKLWHKIWHAVTRSGSISCVSGAAFNRYDGETGPRTLGFFTLAIRHSSCSHLRSGLCEPIVLGILLRCSSDSMQYLAGDRILAGYFGSMQPIPAAGRQGFHHAIDGLGYQGSKTGL